MGRVNHGTAKVECVYGEHHFRTRTEAQQARVDTIGTYHTKRRHSSLGNLSPAAFEQHGHTTSSATTSGATWP